MAARIELTFNNNADASVGSETTTVSRGNVQGVFEVWLEGFCHTDLTRDTIDHEVLVLITTEKVLLVR